MRPACLSFALLVGVAPAAFAQTYEISWWTVDSGGSLGNAGGVYVLDSTSGQPDAGGPLAGSPYVLHGGFWAIAAGVGGGRQADLSISKTDGQAAAIPGQPVTYTIVATNLGPDDVTGATVTDTLPGVLSGASWTCVASAGSSCTAGGAGNIDDSVDLLANGTATYTLTATVDPAAAGTLDNTAGVTVPAGVTDPVPGNNAATDSDTLTPEADLELVKSDAPDPVTPGGTLTYTLQLTNLGPSASTGMTVTDTLPPEVTFVSSNPGSPTCNEAGGTVTCNLPGLAPNAGQVVTIQTTVNPGTSGTISNTATVMGNETDPVSGNDSDTEPTAVGLVFESELVHGSSLWADLESAGGVADEDLFRIGQKAYSSYEVVVDATSGDIGTGQGPELDRIGSDGTTVLQSAVSAGAGSSRSLRWENDTSGVIPDEYVRVRSAGCTTTCGPESVYRIRAWDTTLVCPRFNNSATQVTILILQNTSAVAVSGHVQLWDGAGALVAEPAFNLGARGAFVLNTSTVAAGASGSLTLSHDGRGEGRVLAC